MILLERINEWAVNYMITVHGSGNTNVYQPSFLVCIHITYCLQQLCAIGITISGEHGDGLARSEFVKTQYGQKNYHIFKQLKRFFDPDNILNPDKIISTKKTMLKHLESFETF